MKIYLQDVKNKQKVLKNCFDILSLMAVLQYAVFRFLQATMFDFVYTNRYKYITLGLMLFFGGIRFLFVFYQNEWQSKSKKERTRAIAKLLFGFCLALPFVYVGWRHDYKVLIFMPVVVMSLYDMDSEKILRWFALVIGVLLSATILCSLTGTVRNLTSFERTGYIVGSYGIINTSDFASYFTFLGLIIWCSQAKKNVPASICFGVVFGAVSCFVYWLTESKTLLLCSAMTEIAVLWDCVKENVLRKTEKGEKAANRINKLTIVAFPVICAAFFLLFFLYGKGNDAAVQSDSFLTSRLSDSYRIFEQYGIELFGTTMPIMHGNGRTLIRNWSSGYGYLDVTYAMLAIRYGIIILLIIAGLWVWTTHKALRAGNSRMALTMAIIAFHAFSEARFLDVNYNIFLVMPFCMFSGRKEEEQTAVYTAKWNRWLKYGLLAAWGVGSYLLLPRLLSWLRTIFSLNGWNIGVHEIGALLTSISIVVFAILFWESILLFLQNRYRLAVSILAAVVVFVASGTIAGNSLILTGLAEQKDALDEDEEMIRFVQNCATQPVYAAEKSELYQRYFGGFSDHFFSSEELYRWPRGTIFTDSSVEVPGIVNRGGRYLQISPTSGMYSYDEKVVMAVYAAGYNWTRYYSSERSCDLEDLAVRNGLSLNKDGFLILNGSSQSILSNIEWDQFAGSYEVRYVLDLPEGEQISDDMVVCNLQVMGEAGDRIILERTVHGSDFDMNGTCKIDILYETDDTPQVSYLVIAEDGVQLYLKEITWRRIS